MPWKVKDVMSLRMEFVRFAKVPGAKVSELCRRYGISRKTGYKWLHRFDQRGIAGLVDASRRPHRSPCRSSTKLESAVLRAREQYPDWGCRKLRKVLQRRGWAKEELCSPSTITEILRRHGKLNAAMSPSPGGWTRFEAERPNALSQMDFKGDFALTSGGRCHPLTVLDDKTRFCLGLQACPNERGVTVQQRLTDIFRTYGLPTRILFDNGSPWGSDDEHFYTWLTVWLIRLDIAPVHSRPYHPQTLGKDERFHRTLKLELLRHYQFTDLAESQKRFDTWRDRYNFERPHESLDMKTPSECYYPSERRFPETLPPVEYDTGDHVRKVQQGGKISFLGKEYKLPKAFVGYPVALRYTTTDGVLHVHFCHHRIGQLDLSESIFRSKR